MRSARAGRASATAACLVLSLAAALSLGGVSTVAHAAQEPARTPKAPPRQLELDIEQAAPVGGYTSFVNSGSAVLHISVVTDGGGALLDARPRIDPASDRAVRYPRYNSDPAAPHAVIQVVDRRGTDNLDPGLQPFRFGADFNLDALSEDAGPGGRDNGDNLIQRGLFNQQAQYKIQLDHRIVTCRVKGSLGAVAVSSSVHPVPGTWYRVQCSRQDDQLTIVVTRWDDGVPTSLRQSVSGTIGVVSPVTRTVPVSIGGKLARQGVINGASDQFNGRIDNVFIRVG
ncbi:MAG TPA: hypothetical protein VLK34_09370 [Nocardioidaceae bacterium]|nr:hypothetical protein [Nocardioidaceae bacterium]